MSDIKSAVESFIVQAETATDNEFRKMVAELMRLLHNSFSSGEEIPSPSVAEPVFTAEPVAVEDEPAHDTATAGQTGDSDEEDKGSIL